MTYLMNPATGSVQTEADWRADAESDGWDFDAAELVEVVRDAEGQWVEPTTLAARALRAIPSDRRSEQSRVNGRLGGRPRNRIYGYCPACGNVVYREPGKRHGDGQIDSDEHPVWLLGDESDVNVASLPDVDCGCTDH